jgi:hypothetical protein
VIGPTSQLVDVAFAVCTALDRVGIRVILVGGSAATFYTGDYQSRDVDFVLTLYPRGADARGAIEALGFRPEGQHYAHPDSVYTVDLLGGPPGIGDDLVTTWHTARRDEEVLYVYSRTDCVRDRLAAYYHWVDRSSLRVALLVAKSGPIDLAAIESWSEREGARAKFDEFSRALQGDPI